jgi:hypothetical protein
MQRVQPGKGRKLKLLCLLDGDTRDVLDLGYTRDGTQTGQRQAIERMLSKTTQVGAQKFATFVLAEPPSESFDESDPLDNDRLRFNGEWRLPSKQWLSVREAKIAEAQAKLEESRQRVLDKAGHVLAEQMASAVATVSQMGKQQKAVAR